MFSVMCIQGLKQGNDCESVYVPTIRSGSYADIGTKKFMEDEHIRIDDLSSQVESLLELPKPSAFYAVIHRSNLIIQLLYLKTKKPDVILDCFRFLMAMEDQKQQPMYGTMP